MEAPKIEILQKIYKTAWQFFLGYTNDLPKTSEQWQSLMKEAEAALYTPYVGTQYETFSVKLISLLILELEEMSKEKD